MANEDLSTNRVDILPAQRRVFFLFTAVLLVGTVAVLALVFSAVALSRQEVTQTIQLMNGNIHSSTEGANHDRQCCNNDDKIWVFAIGHDNRFNLEYIDELSGTVRGFHVDLVEAVCNVANKNCRLMWDVYENCYNSQAGKRPRPGVGLVSRWYDGCTGKLNLKLF
ncbi:uncharacterized protein LOC110982119 isoform X2 [Acanthaster planci]|uniref:Uncharacterized protein LOC110982119 isoform X2 n=1 Tax=Acanthaster planci TaxID=133434 RepID=A0A8B7YU55_ACAPL|nr:uncharacterized protein LOC110982119 isoform X2 [Acanthaster planci]